MLLSFRNGLREVSGSRVHSLHEENCSLKRNIPGIKGFPKPEPDMLDARKALPWKVTHASKWVSSRAKGKLILIGSDGIILASVQPVLPHKVTVI